MFNSHNHYTPNSNYAGIYDNVYGNGPYFTGEYHGTAGFGFFSNLVKFATPFVRRLGKNLLTSGINAASDVITDVKSGQSIESSIKHRAPTALKTAALSTLRGQGRSGRKRKKPAKKRRKKKSTKKPPKKKRRSKKTAKKSSKKKSCRYPLFT